MFQSILVAACALTLGQEQPPEKKDAPITIGRIIIVGNERTSDETIRMLVQVRLGEVTTRPALRAAERRLEESNRFEVDPKRNIRPTVTVGDGGDAEPRDIVIRVQERGARGKEAPK